MPELLDMPVDIVGQQAGMQIYTQLSCFFRLPKCHSKDKIIGTLHHGLQRLADHFPWTAGQIINTDAAPGKTGTFRIVPCEKTAPLVVEHADSAPSLHEMEAANWPMTMLNESVFASRMTIPTPEEQKEPFRVLSFQATFIPGGLALTSAAAHNAMDVTGQKAAMRLLSRACRGEKFTDQDLTLHNMDRSNLIPLLEEDVTSQLKDQLVVPGPPPSPPQPATWAYFLFSDDSLAQIKALASQSITTGFISTDDALSAFIWQSVSRARRYRLDGTDKSKLARAVDIRSQMDQSKEYPGMFQNMAYNTFTVQDLIDMPLGKVAEAMRAKLDTQQIIQRTKALATYLTNNADTSSLSFTANIDFSKGIAISSWSKVDCHLDDYGLGLGQPVNVVRPAFIPVEGLMYLMPKNERGIALGICLRDTDMEAFKNNDQVKQFTTFVG